MNKDLIAAITEEIIQKLEPASSILSKHREGEAVKIWDHTIPKAKPQIITAAQKESGFSNEGNVKVWDYSAKPSSSAFDDAAILEELQNRPGVAQPLHPDRLQEMIMKTPARVGVGRAGYRSKTEAWLRFRLDHAAAVDAVYGDVSEELLERLGLFEVRTQVQDKETYIRRPDLGRKLLEEDVALMKEKCMLEPQVQIIVSDGLSSQAIEKNLEDVYLSFQQSLQLLGLKQGVPFFIRKGRVAAMDHVGDILKPEVVVYFIGERPGLVTAESLSAYLCYKPRKGTIEADRMVISNIHAGGIPPVEAGAYLGTVVQKILDKKASGVSLVQKEG